MSMDSALLGMLQRIESVEQRLGRWQGLEIARRPSAAHAILGSNAATTSTTFVDVNASVNVTLTCSGGDVIVLLSGTVVATGASDTFVGVQLDSGTVQEVDSTNTTNRTTIAGAMRFTPSAGSHTFNPKFRNGAGNTSTIVAPMLFVVIDLGH